MINRLRRTYVGVPVGNSDSIGLAVTRGNTIVANYGVALGEKTIPQIPVTSPVKLITADTTLTSADSGKVIAFDVAVAAVVSLPKATDCKGCRFRFTWKTLATSGTGHSVSPDALDGIGGGVTALTTVINKDVINATAGDALTDRLEIVSTGVAGTGAWVITEATAIASFTKQA